MNLDPAIIGLIGVAVGAIAGISGTVFSTLISKRSEERKHKRGLAYNAAIEEWKHSREHAKLLSSQGYSVNMMPIDSYILHMNLLSDILEEKGLSDEELADRIRSMHTRIKSVEKAFESVSPKPKAQQRRG